MKVLLADFGNLHGICLDLKKILVSSTHPDIKTFHCQIDSKFPAAMGESKPDAVIIALDNECLAKGLQLIKSRPELSQSRSVLIALDSADPDRIRMLLEAGATDFLIRPFTEGSVLPRIWRLIKYRSAAAAACRDIKEKAGLKQIVGEDPEFVAQIEKIKSVARYDVNVLIQGETGTGKELCARAIHYLSPRSEGPFVPINCGAIPDDLVENELFGHEKGAFTGAGARQSGLISEAEGGSLFLDEVSSLSSLAQAKILRFLQDGEFRMLGASKVLHGDVRVIAASNVDLEQAAGRGQVREDLFYRLNTVPLNLPPLRRRCEDVPLLARHFSGRFCRKFSKDAAEFSAEAMEKLVLHRWPGNVRELEHVVERAVLLTDGQRIEARSITLPKARPCARSASFKEAKAKVIADFEKAYVRRVLVAHRGNIAQAAQAAGKDRRSFWELIRKHGIDVQSIKQRLALIPQRQP